jgi:two-component system, NtrC family, sensor kinase
MLNLLLILLLNITPVVQPDQLFIASDSLFDNYGRLALGTRDGWRFHPGDNMNWADPDFDDSAWMFYTPMDLTEPIPDSLWDGYGWFRYRFAADSSAYAIITHLLFETWGAAEVYLDGKLVNKYGVFSTNLQDERLYNIYGKIPAAIALLPAESHVLAVRYSYHKGKRFYKLLGKYSQGFGFRIGLATDKLNQEIISEFNLWRAALYIFGTMLFLILLLHGFLFVLVPAERSNLYISIVVLLLFLHNLRESIYIFFEPDVLQTILVRNILFIMLFMAAFSMLPLTISSMFHQKPRFLHKLLIWMFPFIALANFIISGPFPGFIVIIFIVSIVFFSFPALMKAWKSGQQGVWFVAAGFLGSVVSAVLFILHPSSPNYREVIYLILAYMTYTLIPIGLTAFMAIRFRDLFTGLEQKVRERTQKLKQSLDDLRSTQSQLIHSEKMASLGELTAGIAHEIQNPLNFVNNFSEVNSELIDELEEEAIKGNLEEVKTIAKDIKENEQKINHHGKRADAIVKGMLQHSRTNSGVKELTDINALADEYLRLSYHGMRAKDKSFNAEYKKDFDPNLPKINIVPQDMGRVLLNLINNAFYAVHQRKKSLSGFENDTCKPTVTVSTRKKDNRIEITVKDNGNGIPEAIREKIFQPFFTTKPTGQGTGLGLSLAYDIVKTHGGEIKMGTKSENLPIDQTGTIFIIELPINKN